jgi:hypothetical protein
MKTVLFLFGFLMIFGFGASGQSGIKPNPEIVMEIADLPCEQVWEKVIRSLKRNKIPLCWADKNKGYIETEPVLTAPFPGDPFLKIEERYRLEIKCSEPLVTQMTCHVFPYGLTRENKWVKIPDVAKYEKRFFDNLKLSQ